MSCKGQFYLTLSKPEGRGFLEPSGSAQACKGIALLMQEMTIRGMEEYFHIFLWVILYTEWPASPPITLPRRTKCTLWIGSWAVPGASVATAAKIKTASPFGDQIPLLCCPGPMPNQYRQLTDYWIMLKIANESLEFDSTIWTNGWCFTVLRHASLRTARNAC